MSVEDAVHRRHVPQFSNWDYCEDSPMPQYFDSTVPQAAMYHRGCGYGGGYYDRTHLYPPLPPYYYYGQHTNEDLYSIPPPSVPTYPCKGKRQNSLEKQLRQLKQVVKENESPVPTRRTRQARVFDCEVAAQESIRRQRAAKAVDEDLYKIPPELLQRKQRKKPVMCDFLSSCLGLNCVV